MLRLITTLIGFSITLHGFAQFTVSGNVEDRSINQPLVGATIQTDKGNKTAITDTNGYFVIHDLAEGKYTLLIRFLGYKEERVSLQVNQDQSIAIEMNQEAQLTEEVIVYATRATDKSPTTFSNLNQAEINKQNFGQDLPFILKFTPSLVTTSDAGTGIGYTGLRIRGSDATRINVTINGIPYNDSESQGVFWVDIPDIATSTQSMQVQRGVGTSTNGAGAFGASINLQTNSKNDESYAEVINSVGSFSTRRHTVGFGTGLINDKFAFDGRASLINSDGFIDRASSDLKSYYASGGYYGRNSIFKLIAFGGKEITYQSWYGVPESRLNNEVAAMMTTATTEGWNTQQTNNLLNSSARTFNIYDYKDQVDNYAQDNFQFHASHRLNSEITANVSLHYTLGKGYYEEFKYDQTLSDYGVADVLIGDESITNSDLIRRRWLDNDFYGFTYSVNYTNDRYDGTFGGALNRYEGDHFGEITWAGVALTAAKDFRYYFNRGDKKDFNLFWKSNLSITNKLNGYLDLQYRRIDYSANGTENDLTNFNVDVDYNFFNPKVGLTYELSFEKQLYVSYAVAQREPVRDDFINARVGFDPKPEKLRNLEMGWRMQKANHSFNINYYLMDYKDQLVLTGELNDVGAAIRTNVNKSYRTGIELEGAIRFNNKLTWSANLTLSQNKIRRFTEVLYDYGVNYDEFNEVQNQYNDVDISFSPDVIAGSILSVTPVKSFEMALQSKYVGRQFLDNTSNDSRKIDAYFINDLRFSYTPTIPVFKELGISLLINNILDVAYESNGYTYGFLGGGAVSRENYYYPQAGRNYLLMLTMKF